MTVGIIQSKELYLGQLLDLLPKTFRRHVRTVFSFKDPINILYDGVPLTARRGDLFFGRSRSTVTFFKVLISRLNQRIMKTPIQVQIDDCISLVEHSDIPKEEKNHLYNRLMNSLIRLISHEVGVSYE